MRNKVVGYIIIGFAILVGLIVFSYHSALIDIGEASCTKGNECPHLKESNQQLLINGIILAVLIFIGIYLIFFSQEERIITKIKKIKSQIEPNKITKKNYEQIFHELKSEEKDILTQVIDSQGSVFQSDLVKKTGMSKVAITRILDRLEGKNLIERRRRGMTNIVILKH